MYAARIVAEELQAQTADVLARLIQFDTVNPPGNERAAAEYLQELLEEAGFETEILSAEPERPNLVARLKPEDPSRADDGPKLCLLSHLDTVLADPEDWERGPWSGDVDEDGFLWGRGALDMKNHTAAEVVAALELAREGWRPTSGELLVVAVCDEEVGGALGAKWLTETHPDKVRCDYLLNEGGGAVMPYGDRRLYGVCCGEKGTFRFSVTATGVAGHASIPGMGDNALLKLVPVLDQLGRGQPEYDLTDVPKAWLEALGEDPGDLATAIEHIRANDPRLARMVEPTLGVTVVPTRIRASEKINVIPAKAELKVDCRVPPGLGIDQAMQRIGEVLKTPPDVKVEFLEQVVGNSSPAHTDFYEAIGEWIEANDPGAEVVPMILPGFTDSRWFRNAFPDCVAYGFFPHKHMDLYEAAPLIHSANERIDVRDLGYAAQFYYDITKRMLT